MMFAFSLFVGLYSLLFASSIWYTGVGAIVELVEFYLIGGIVAGVLKIIYIDIIKKSLV